MAISSSDFYNQLNKYELARKKGIENLAVKNVVVSENATLDIVADNILSIQQNYSLTGDAVIVTAELGNVTLTLRDSSDTVIDTQNTGSTGSVINFIVPNTQETYTVTATDAEDNELWTNSITVTGTGTFNCKVGKALSNYSWAEIKEAGVKNFAQYMWSVGDEKKIESFMGSTSDEVTVFVIAGFNIKEKVGGGFGITFIQKGQTSATYQWWSDSNTNSNGFSWEGCLPRQNCLREGEVFHLYDRSVTSETTGTFYIWDNDNKLWVEKTLPADYVANTKYFTRETKTANGAFWNGLSDDILPYISQVKNKTWGGYGGAVTNSTTANADNTIIETKDWLFIPSDSEVFGDSERINNYSKYALEGEQFPYFNQYQEGRLQRSNNSWTRSPYLSNSNYACTWTSNGYVYHDTTYLRPRVVLCFTL